MKKCCIVSFQFESNYGALLQAFALQKKCNQLGFEAFHLNYVPKYYFSSPYVKSKRHIPFFIVRIYRWFHIFLRSLIVRNNGNLINKKFTLLKKRSWRDALKSNILIAGSDQIWNQNFMWGREKVYFLGFGRHSVKRVSYAASLGSSSWPQKFKQKVLPYLKQFNAVSVRENSSIAYLESIGIGNVKTVCDPTILHDSSFYRSELSLKSKPNRQPFVYLIWRDLPCCMNSILNDNCIFIKLRDRNNRVLVEQWVQHIFNAKFVITDSFHCAVFCILFHKPFIVLANHGTGKGMNERFQTLLGKTDLLYRVLPPEAIKEDVEERLNRPIDWDKIDAIMEEWRTYSANWLKDALEN